MKNLNNIKNKIEEADPKLWNDFKMFAFNVLEEGFKIIEDNSYSKDKYREYYKKFKNKREEIKKDLGIDKLNIEPYQFLK